MANKNVSIGSSLPYAPAAHGGYDTVPETEAERNSGLLSKLHLGKLAAFGAAVEIPAAVAALITGEPVLLAAGPVVTAPFVAASIEDAHNYFRNAYRPTAPFNRLVKAKTLER